MVELVLIYFKGKNPIELIGRIDDTFRLVWLMV